MNSFGYWALHKCYYYPTHAHYIGAVLLCVTFMRYFQIYIWQLLNEDLIGVAFIDTNIYIHSITVVRSLILAADIAKSITLLRYKEDLKVLSLISKVRS